MSPRSARIVDDRMLSATFRFRVENVAALGDGRRLRSSPVTIGGVAWRCFVASPPPEQVGDRCVTFGISVDGGDCRKDFQCAATYKVVFRDSSNVFVTRAPHRSGPAMLRRGQNIAWDMFEVGKHGSAEFIDGDGITLEVFIEVEKVTCLETSDDFASSSDEASDCRRSSSTSLSRTIAIPKKKKGQLKSRDVVATSDPQTTGQIGGVNAGQFGGEHIDQMGAASEQNGGKHDDQLNFADSASSTDSIDACGGEKKRKGNSYELLSVKRKRPFIATTAVPVANKRVQTDPVEEEQFITSARDLLEALTCQVCRAQLEPPIKLCDTGHSICGACESALDACPTCLADFADDQRNFALESVMDFVFYECGETGCGAKYKLIDKHRHRTVCEHRDVACTVPGCAWNGSLAVFQRTHFTQVHRDICNWPAKGAAIMFEFAVIEIANGNAGFFVNAGFLPFEVRVTKADDPGGGSGGLFYLCARLLGTATDASRYVFRATLASVDPTRRNRASFGIHAHCDLENSDGQCVTLGTEANLRKNGLVADNGTVTLEFSWHYAHETA